jgi:O-antigen/teichoic acid export membrane protein
MGRGDAVMAGEAPRGEQKKRGSRVLGDSIIYVSGTVVQRGLSLLLLPVVTRVLGVEEYGLASTASALAALLAIVYGLGMNFAIVRSYYDDSPESPSAGWAALLRAQALLAGMLAVATYLTGPYWSSIFEDFGWAPALQVAVVYGYVNALQLTAQGVLRAARRPVAFVIATLIQLCVGSGLGIALAASHGAAGYLTGLTIGSGLATAFSLGLTYRPAKWRREVVFGGLALGFPFMFHTLAGWGMNLSDRLLIAFYLGLADVGRYNVAYVLATAITLILSSVQAAWGPYYIGQLTDEAKRRIPPAIVLPVTAVAGAATALLVIAAPLLLALLAPPEFGGVDLVIPLVAAATLARAPYFVAVIVLLDARTSRTLAGASLAGVAVNVGINIALIPTLGLPAAAAATTLALVVQAVLVLRTAQRIVGASMRIGTLCLVWAAGTAVLVGCGTLPESPAGIALRVALAVAFCGLGWLAVRWLASSARDMERRESGARLELAGQPIAG